MPRVRAHTRSAVPVGNRTPRSKGSSRTREDRIGELITVQDDGCWIFTGTVKRYGYYGADDQLVHRYVYETLIGCQRVHRTADR